MPIGCLLPQFVDKFKEAIGSGKIDPDELMNMSSVDRRNLLTDIVGEENIHDVNSLIESKLLLKNQKQGIINAIKKLGGLSDTDRSELIKLQEERLTKYMDPKDMDNYLSDLAQDKVMRQYKILPTEEQTKNIIESTRVIEEAKSKIKIGETPPKSAERLDYGLKQRLLNKTISELKKRPFKWQDLFNPSKVITAIGGSMKSAVASFDNSFFGRQGIKTLYTNPDIWVKDFAKSWVDIGKQLVAKGKIWKSGDDAVTDMIYADILSRDNALNGKYNAGGFDVGIKTEEAFPSSAPEAIPVLGRAFKASEVAYNGGALRMRADLADRVIAGAEKFGVDTLDKSQSQPLGELVNGLTGRGTVNLTEDQSKFTNATIFSIKFVKSNYEILTNPIRYVAKKSKLLGGFENKGEEYALKQSAGNITKIITSMAAILGTAELLNPGSVDFDPNSTNFGKIKIAGVPVDISGGLTSMLTLAVRIIPQKRDGVWGFYSTSGTTGKVTKLNADKYGSRSVMDVLESYFEGKLSPIAGVLRDVWSPTDYSGNKPTVYNEIRKVTISIGIQQWQQLKDDKSAHTLGLMLLDGLGFSINPPNKPNKILKLNIDNRTPLQKLMGKTPTTNLSEEKVKNNTDLQSLIYGMTDPNTTKSASEKEQIRKDNIEVLKTFNANSADINSILDKYFKTDEKDLKNPNSSTHNKTKNERRVRLNELLKGMIK